MEAWGDVRIRRSNKASLACSTIFVFRPQSRYLFKMRWSINSNQSISIKIIIPSNPTPERNVITCYIYHIDDGNRFAVKDDVNFPSHSWEDGPGCPCRWPLITYYYSRHHGFQDAPHNKRKTGPENKNKAHYWQLLVDCWQRYWRRLLALASVQQ